MIPIYKQEIEAGIEEIVCANKIVFASTVRLVKVVEDTVKLDVLSNANANPDQRDLYYLESVLASTGWNKNTDVFDRNELIGSKSTPVDKKFNYMHDEKDIIGHITSSCIVDFDGNKINSDVVDDIPNEFDIVVGSVLYKTWQDEKLQDRMDQIIAEIANDKWFVSMECLFRGFDYAVITPEGENKVIARNEKSSFLTKHLKQYGGEGIYEGYQIGRLLRNYSFSGEGLVDKPANPRSFITSFNNKSEVSAFSSNSGAFASVNEFSMGEKVMSEKVDTVSRAQYDEMKVELEKVKASVEESKQKEVADIQKKFEDAEEARSKANIDLKANEEILVVKDEKITSLEDELKETKAKLDDINKEIEKTKAEAIKSERLTRLLSKVDEEKAKELVEKFSDVNDDLFATLFESLPEKVESAKKEDKEDKEKKEDKKAESATENLDEAKENNADLNVNGETETVAQQASAWFNDILTKKE